MFEYLEGYLDTFTTPEQGTLILNAAKALLENGIDDHLFLLQNELDRADNETQDTVDTLVEILRPFLIRAIRELGMTMDPETDLDNLLSTFQALCRIDNWDDKSSISALCDGVEGPEAAVADILELVGDRSAGEYLMNILSVADEMLGRIREVVAEETWNELPSPVVVAGVQSRLRTLLSKGKFDDDSPFIKALDNGMRLGIPFKLIIQPNLESLHDVSVSKLGQEMVAFAYASDTPNEQIPEVLRNLRESFELSMTDSMQVEQDIRHLL